jgi:hypothetical protein
MIELRDNTGKVIFTGEPEEAEKFLNQYNNPNPTLIKAGGKTIDVSQIEAVSDVTQRFVSSRFGSYIYLEVIVYLKSGNEISYTSNNELELTQIHNTIVNEWKKHNLTK